MEDVLGFLILILTILVLAPPVLWLLSFWMNFWFPGAF